MDGEAYFIVEVKGLLWWGVGGDAKVKPDSFEISFLK